MCLYFRHLILLACGVGGDLQMCVFLEIVLRVNELRFVFLNAQPTSGLLSTSGLLFHISQPGANHIKPDEPRGRRVNPPVWPSGLYTHTRDYRYTNIWSVQDLHLE